MTPVNEIVYDPPLNIRILPHLYATDTIFCCLVIERREKKTPAFVRRLHVSRNHMVQTVLVLFHTHFWGEEREKKAY